jgi:glycosyltransferase involved in cell wall biosynthesis/SAM-dependent methyltransferase
VNDDRIWEMYFSDAYREETREACQSRIDWIVAEARGRVLDLGCSQGLVPILIGRRGLTVVGVDVEAPAIEFARERLADEPPEVQARVSFQLADGNRWEPAETFDTVILGEVLEHLPEPATLVAAARQHLVDGGRLIVTVPMGWLEHHDHRQELLPADLVALLAPGFGVEALDVVDSKIRVLATAGAASRPDVVAPARLAGLVAQHLLALQHGGGAEVAALKARLAELEQARKAAQRKASKLETREADLKAKVQQLSSDKKRLRDSASYQLGALLVGVGMRPRSVLQLPRRLARLAWSHRNSVAAPRSQGPGNARSAALRDVYDGKFRVALPGVQPLRDPVDGRVLHLLEYSLPHTQNGYTLRSFHIVQAQKQHGWDPVVVTKPGFPDGVDGAGPETVAGAPHYRLTGKALNGDADYLPRYIEASAAEAAPIVEQVRPSIIQAGSNFRNAYPALELARTYQVPFVYEVRGLWEETRVANGTLRRDDARYDNLVGVEAYCARNADAVVTLGASLKEALVERGVPAEKIFLVPNAVEIPEKLPLRRPSLVARLGLADRFVVGYIGSVTPLESLHVLIEAIARLDARRRDVAALIVGDGAALEDLRALAARLGVEGSVKLIGSVPHREVRDYYAITDAIACTRGHDRVCSVVTPLKPYEAMAYARPVIVSDIPALREMVTDKLTGRLVRAADPDALARVIEELADDRAGCRALGERAAAWVREHRTWQRVVEGYAPAYAYARDAFARRARGAR